VPQQTGLAALEGLLPLAPMPIEHAPEVAVLSMRGWVRRKSLDVMNGYKQVRMSIWGQTVVYTILYSISAKILNVLIR
jgi:hypothetical protein